MIILDFGSGNTCRNKWSIAKKMIDTFAEIDKERKCIIKWQLFEKAGENIPLKHDIFYSAFAYTSRLGFKMTASVFDSNSLNYLLNFGVPFVKIPNRKDLGWLVGEVPRKKQVIISTINYSPPNHWPKRDKFLCCISKYPATIEEYESTFDEWNLRDGISDHTTDWSLYRKYKPEIYECHFCLDDSTGPDAGPFARRPSQLKEIL